MWRNGNGTRYGKGKRPTRSEGDFHPPVLKILKCLYSEGDPSEETEVGGGPCPLLIMYECGVTVIGSRNPSSVLSMETRWSRK